MMSAENVLRELLASGIEPSLTPDETGIEVPAGRLSDSQRAAIRQHKAELIERLRESARITVALLKAASRAPRSCPAAFARHPPRRKQRPRPCRAAGAL